MLKCDEELKSSWYRFTGDAGFQMANKCMRTGDTACSALGAGWLVGSHPTIEEGVVSRGVCFRTRSSCCSSTINIKVKNCGQYMIYYLIAPENCPYRYCSSKHPQIIKGTRQIYDQSINQSINQYLLFCIPITVYVDSSFPIFITFNIFAIDSISYRYRFLGVECPVSKLTLRFPS